MLVAALGVLSFTRLPIDAVPDITNVQVIVNVEAPGYTPLEAEQRITVPLETAMAGLPRLVLHALAVALRARASHSRIRGRHGHLFRATARAERMLAARGDLPEGREPVMGPIATGLGEIFMFTVDAEPGAKNADGIGRDADGSAYGSRLDHPAAAAARARRGRSESDRRLSQGNSDRAGSGADCWRTA